MHRIFLLASSVLGRPPKLGQPAQVISRAAVAAPSWPTTVWSTVLTTSGFAQFVDDRHWTNYETLTVTTIPGPMATITVYPTTVTQTVISHITWDERTTYTVNYPSLSSTTSVSSTSYTDLQNYVLAQPKAADLPAGTNTEKLPCNQCPSSGINTGSAQCAAKGLQTGCQGQCERRAGGVWWCYVLREYEYSDAGLRMGRACWGGNLEYEQLDEPCVEGDYAVPCTPCQGLNASWGAVNWV